MKRTYQNHACTVNFFFTLGRNHLAIPMLHILILLSTVGRDATQRKWIMYKVILLFLIPFLLYTSNLIYSFIVIDIFIFVAWHIVLHIFRPWPISFFRWTLRSPKHFFLASSLPETRVSSQHFDYLIYFYISFFSQNKIKKNMQTEFDPK